MLTEKTRAAIKMRLNIPARALTESIILYTDKDPDGHKDRHMGGRADSSIIPKTFVLRGYNYF